MKEEDNCSLVLGIDDAGRGCVLGNMVLAGCLMKKELEQEFKKLGIKDSKLLSPIQREKLVKMIKEKVISFAFHMATPVEIDTGMGEGLNLNLVEALSAGTIINELTEKLSKSEKENIKIILDCPSINTAGWKNQLMGYVKDKKLDSRIVCEHKADFNHPVVSAASIIAKTTRDSEIEKLKKEVGFDFGSGYPADPYTKKALIEHGDELLKKRIIRESWATWQEIVGNKINKNMKQTTL
ncbi:MAG: ribonuclease HII [Nanoarchaeota archaeon]